MVNKQTIIGRLGKDPEVKILDGGAVVAKFPIASSETWKDKSGEKHEETEWFNIVAWNKLAEIIEKYVKKGDLIYIEGKTKTRIYKDKDGDEKRFTEVVCDVMKMLGSKPDKIEPVDKPHVTNDVSVFGEVPPPEKEENPFI